MNDKTITLDELRTEKIKLEVEMNRMIGLFNKRTGVKISDIGFSVMYLETLRGNESQIIDTRVEVEL